MKKKVLFSLCLAATTGALHAQVGVNNTDPKASLHITPQKTDGTTAEGIIAPNLTRAQLIGKDVRYTAAQKGAIVYVTAVDGTVTTKTTKITTAGYYYFDGALWQPFSQAETIIPTEPWQVQGGTTAATSNTQNIYQTGSVGIGASTAVPAAYKLQVTGASNVTGNSRVASSTVVGAQTVGTTLGVTGATTLSNSLTVAGATTLNGATTAKATTITGLMKYTNTVPAVGQYLRASAVDGSVAWATLPTTATTEPWQVQGGAVAATTNAQNIYQTGSIGIGASTAVPAAYKLQVTGASNVTGNSRVASSTVVGAQTVGTTLGVTGTSTLTGKVGVGRGPAGSDFILAVGGNTYADGTLTVTGTTTSKATNMGGLLKYKPTTEAVVVGQYLRASAVDGSVSWATLPATATSEPWQVQGATTAATTNAQNIYQTGSIGIGASTAVPAAYKLQVTGASNVTGNSRVASSTVVGAQTVGTTLGVTGATTLSSTLSVLGTSSLRGATTVGTTTANANLVVYGNAGIGASPLHKLHVVGNEYVSGTARIGGVATASTLNTSAQLDLADNNKGFLPNRVALTSATVKSPVVGAVDGMMVYNTATVAAQDITPGFYYWKANKWNRLVDGIPQTTINIRDLIENCVSNSQVATNTQLGSPMNFDKITIPEDGAYAFSFRLYGLLTSKPATGSMIFYYIALLSNGVLEDTAEMDIISGSNSNVLTYSVTLGGSFKAGDVVTCRLSHNPTSPFPWTLAARPLQKRADRTSLVWWKL